MATEGEERRRSEDSSSNGINLDHVQREARLEAGKGPHYWASFKQIKEKRTRK